MSDSLSLCDRFRTTLRELAAWGRQKVPLGVAEEMKRSPLVWIAATVASMLFGDSPIFAQLPTFLPSGAAVIRGKAGESEIVVTTTPRLAGAIHSLTWNGREFIDSADHGRQLQSALNGDLGSPITAETFNPTEAGSRRDGAGSRSTSRLLHLHALHSELQTTTQMAFWLTPREKSDGNPAKNETLLSNHLLTKRVRIGMPALPNVMVYDVTFSLPIGERHNHVVFEALTGYMPPEFSKFWKFDPATGQLSDLTDGPGEQPLPVVLATPDGSHAMGIWSPGRSGEGWAGPGYGRFRFPEAKVVKWNCVYRLTNATGIPAADYSFRQYVSVGTLEMVRAALVKLSGK